MKRLDVIIRSSKFDEVSSALAEVGVPFFTFFEVTGFGKQKGKERTYRGTHYAIDYIRRTKIEIIVEDEDVEKVIQTVMENARTGEIGDGKIFVSDINQIYRVRTGETGQDAL